jgi:hypothetical protein
MRKRILAGLIVAVVTAGGSVGARPFEAAYAIRRL